MFQPERQHRVVVCVGKDCETTGHESLGCLYQFDGVGQQGLFVGDYFELDPVSLERLTPELRVNARLRAVGWLGGDRLPVQRRVSLGGTDLLPGYDFRAFACAPTGFVAALKMTLRHWAGRASSTASVGMPPRVQASASR